MKKIIILLSIFLISGCTNNLNKVDLNKINNDIMYVISSPSTHSNMASYGFKYYKPRDFAVLSDSDFNHTLINEGNKYYLSVDINAYYNKFIEKVNENTNDFFFTTFNFEDKEGYLEITKSNNNYFYIKMMYNYSYIEVSVEEHNINDAVISSAIILSSIKYNDKIIENIIEENKLSSKETSYELKSPKDKTESKNILDVYNYDSFEE